MDDQNQTNKPLDQGVASGMPLDITPQNPPAPLSEPTPPATTTFTTTVSTPAEPVVPKVETPVAAPWESPIATPVTTPPMPMPEPEIPQPDAKTSFTTSVTMPTPMPTEPVVAPVEPEMPAGKPKSKMMPIIGGIVALLLVVGVAGAAYYVSNQLSSRQAVAPNAPESQPAAFSDCARYDPNECSTHPGCTFKASEGCIDTVGSTCTPNQSCHNVANNQRGTCNSSGTVCNYTENYCNDGNGCTGWIPASQSCAIWFANNNYCSGGGGDGGGGGSSTFACGPQPCTSGQLCCCTGCTSDSSCDNHGGVTCETVVTYPTCTAEKRDPLNSPQTITFTKAGTVNLYTRSAASTVTLSSTSRTNVVNFTAPDGAAVKATPDKPLVVTAGEIYNIAVHRTDTLEHGAASYGWITPRSDGTCGPKIAEGVAIDTANHTTGNCGDKVAITEVTTAASSALDIIGITGQVQCWSDALRSTVPTVMAEDATQDFDFNDFTLVFGYEKADKIVGACVEILISKKVGGTYTPLTTQAQLNSLKVNDVVRFSVKGNLNGMSGRFRVTVGGVASEWLGGLLTGESIGGAGGVTISSSDFTITTAGTYTFEGQVSAANSGASAAKTL